MYGKERHCCCNLQDQKGAVQTAAMLSVAGDGKDIDAFTDSETCKAEELDLTLTSHDKDMAKQRRVTLLAKELVQIQVMMWPTESSTESPLLDRPATRSFESRHLPPRSSVHSPAGQ